MSPGTVGAPEPVPQAVDDRAGPAERLRNAVVVVGGLSGVTASVGAAEVQPGGDVAELLHRAEAAMHRSTAAGGIRLTAQLVGSRGLRRPGGR